MFVLEAIGLCLKGLKVALVLLEFATGAIFFSIASGFYGLELVADQLKIALFGAKNGVDARLSALRAFGARGASA